MDKKPSLTGVAVSAFYDKLKHQLSQCQSYRKPHTLHLLCGDVANRLLLCSARCISTVDTISQYPTKSSGKRGCLHGKKKNCAFT